MIGYTVKRSGYALCMIGMLNITCNYNTVIPFRKNPKYPCQDIVINNQIIQEHNHKACKMRYNLLEHILSRYSRPFTMLDIGARQGYFSLRAAYTYPRSTFVLIEDNSLAKQYPHSDLLEICIKNTALHNIVLLNRDIIAEDLLRLSECEHFDVVVAFNLFSPRTKNGSTIIEHLLNLGDNILFEVPHELADLNSYLREHDCQMLWQFEHSTLWIREGHKTLLLRRHWLRPLTSTLTIESTYESKKLIKVYNKISVTDWVPGINLVTYKMCFGIYPTVEQVSTSIDSLKNIVHSDWLVHNMIIQGQNIVMIDGNDPRHEDNNSTTDNDTILYNRRKRMLLKILEWIQLENPQAVAAYYEHKHMEYW